MDTEIRRRLRWVELFPKVRGCFEFLETGEEEMGLIKRQLTGCWPITRVRRI
jgi:hypothetical protein